MQRKRIPEHPQSSAEDGSANVCKETTQGWGKNHPNGLKEIAWHPRSPGDSACSYQPEWEASSFTGHWAVPQKWEIISPTLV